MINVMVLGTGGTIATRRSPSGALIVTADVETLLEQIPPMPRAMIAGRDLMQRPSFALSWDD
ncbi:MAG: asparaginase domain-containing protein, partial [Sciscionella sp.]